jgi:DNA mismatch endonuclease (patch repair protein)
MADIFSKRKRSAVMSAIRSRGNRDTELRLIAIFRAHGIIGWTTRSVAPGKS